MAALGIPELYFAEIEVYLNEKYERIMIPPGFKESPDLMKELRFAAEEIYSKTSWEAYRDGK